MFRWWRNRWRRRIMDQPFPPWWEAILKRNVGHFARLPSFLQSELKKITQVIVSEKRWEGCGGFTITEEVKVTIAAQAAIPILACRHEYYDRVKTILVYPSTFQTPNEEDDYEDDHLSDDLKAGQAFYRGPVILSWDVVLEEGRNPGLGHNVVIHEFAHQIDFLDYDADGTPPIQDPVFAKRWQDVMLKEYDQHRALLEAGGETFFSEQAGDDATEFFADVCEAFFCSPTDMAEAYPAVYALFSDYFQMNPREWFSTP